MSISVFVEEEKSPLVSRAFIMSKKKLQYLVTVVVVVVVKKNTCLISIGLSHTVAVQEHSTLMLV